jgi:hypothetical protein
LLLLPVLALALGALISAGQVPPLHLPGGASPTTPVVEQPPPPFVPDEAALKVPPGQQKLAYCVVIDNREGGLIRIVDPPAQFLLARPGVAIGTVVRPATLLNTESFHASLWGKAGTVVASAVNAVHIKAYDQSSAPRAAVITLVPKELLDHELDGSQAVVRDDQIYTDIPGGRGIFGGAYPLIPGNPASVSRDKKLVQFSAQNNSLKIGDIIVVQVQTPQQWPRQLLVQNVIGGKVTITDATGAQLEIGSVEKPVTGTGRFSGGVFSASGGIRATHSGVLDIDFSPAGELGGLQFIPHAHSLSPEMTYSQESPPYGILLGPNNSDLRGQAPVFSGYLYPQSGLEPPKVLPRLVISVQFSDYTRRAPGVVAVEPGTLPWLPLPSLSGREDLSDLTALRIEWVTGAAFPTPPVPATPAPPAAAPAAESPTRKAPHPRPPGKSIPPMGGR